MSLQVLLQSLLSEEQLYAWGWRLPFVVGALLAVVVFWIRRGIEETSSFTQAKVALSAAHSVMRLCRVACSGGFMVEKLLASARHLRLWPSLSWPQVAARGFRDCFSAGVNSFQAP